MTESADNGAPTDGLADCWAVWDEEAALAAGAGDDDRVVYVLTAADVAAGYDHMAGSVEGTPSFADLSPEQRNECIIAAKESLDRWHWMDLIYEAMDECARTFRGQQ